MLRELQAALVRALADADPASALRREAAALPAEARALLEKADADGLAITALIVKKLRFERICRGDDAAAAWFGRDPRGFTKAFKAYDAAVPPTRFFPQTEAAEFRGWLRANGFHEPEGPGGVKEA